MFIDNPLAILSTFGERDIIKDDRIPVTWSSFYLFASALITDTDQAMQHFPPEACQMVIERFTHDIDDLSYRELKMGFITLSFFAKLNVPNAFDRAGDISQRILDADEYEEEKNSKYLQIHQIQEFYDERQLIAFVPALPFQYFIKFNIITKKQKTIK